MAARPTWGDVEERDWTTASPEEIDQALGARPKKDHLIHTSSGATVSAQKEYDRRRAKIDLVRSKAFQAGQDVNGFTADAGGGSLTPEQRAAAIRSKGISVAQEGFTDIGEYQPKDYTYTPAQRGPVGSYDLGTEQVFDQTRTDSTGLDAQRNALGGYEQVLNQGGLTALDRARFQQAQQMREQEARGQRQAALAGAEQMGRAGGNASLLAQLTANQGSTNRLANDQLQIQALGLQRQDQARSAYGTLGGQIQSAQDAIDYTNTLGARGREERRVQAGNLRGRDVFTESNRANEQDTKAQTDALAFAAGPTGGKRGYIAARDNARTRVLGAGEAAAGGMDRVAAAKAAESAANKSMWASLAGKGADLLLKGVGAAVGGPPGAAAGGAVGDALTEE